MSRLSQKKIIIKLIYLIEYELRTSKRRIEMLKDCLCLNLDSICISIDIRRILL